MQSHSRSGHQADGQTTTATDSETSSIDIDANAAVNAVVIEEVLIEEISIDGMCGVY